MWAIGPPKEVRPRRRNVAKTSPAVPVPDERMAHGTGAAPADGRACRLSAGLPERAREVAELAASLELLRECGEVEPVALAQRVGLRFDPAPARLETGVAEGEGD